MLVNWTAGLDDEAAKDVASNFNESKVTRRRLTDILLAKIDDARKESSSKSMYDSPNWAYTQADRMGYERSLRDVINYLQD